MDLQTKKGGFPSSCLGSETQISYSSKYYNIYSPTLPDISKLFNNIFLFDQLMFNNSTSKRSVAFGGIIPDIPIFPYAYSGGQTNIAFSPRLIRATPSSHPLITCSAPRVKVKGSSLSREESNLVPFWRVPM